MVLADECFDWADLNGVSLLRAGPSPSSSSWRQEGRFDGKADRERW